MNDKLLITYKIYMEADDIKQSRIASSASYVKNLFTNCQNCYFHQVEVDDESDMDDFSLRLYVDHTIEEAACSHPKDAKHFVADMFEFLDAIAHAQSYMEMEGSFAIEYQDEKEAFTFTSEGDQDYCDFKEA